MDSPIDSEREDNSRVSLWQRWQRATPTDEPLSGSVLPASWGMLIGLFPLLLILPLIAFNPSGYALSPAVIVIGFMLGLIIWDTPKVSPEIRLWSPIAGAFLALILLLIIAESPIKGSSTWLSPARPIYGLIWVGFGTVWYFLRRISSGLLLVTGAGYLIGASYLNSTPNLWPLIPAFVLTYVPLLYWDKCSKPLRAGGLVGNALILAPLHDALPSNLLGTSWALLALPLLYVLAMVIAHRVQEENRRVVAYWMIALFGVTLYLASFADQVWLSWLPVPELLILMVALGALYAVLNQQGKLATRWVIIVLALAHLTLAITTFVGSVRSGHSPADSVVLLLFAIGIGSLALIPRPPLYAPKQAQVS